MNFSADDLVKIIGLKELEIHALKAQIAELQKQLEKPPLKVVDKNG